jgi:hypothetical protein
MDSLIESLQGISLFDPDVLAKNIENELTTDIITKNGDTQKAERTFIEIVKKELTKLTKEPFKQAGSQEPIDFQNVIINGKEYFFECKKCNKGNTFIFNDSVIDPGVYYIFCSAKKVKIIKGSDIELLDEPNDGTLETDITELKKHVNELTPENINFQKIRFIFNIILCISKESVLKKIITLFDYSSLFKMTTNFGKISSRPRPNWSVKVSF